MEWLTNTRYAHRGLHDLNEQAPENSLAAFNAAAMAGYGIELDVRLSADGEPVVFHDRTLDTLTDRTGPVSACTAEKLVHTRLQDTFETIPRLREALKLVAGRVPVLIEIKNNRQPVGPLEQATSHVINAYGGPCGILSFNAHSVRWFRDNAPQTPRGRTIVGLGATSGTMLFWQRMILRPSAAMVRCDPHFYAYDLQALPAVTLRRPRLPVIAWTVRNKSDQSIAESMADNFIFENMRP